MNKQQQKILLLYIVIAYLVQGLAEHFCLLAQPLDNYFLKVQHWDAAQVSVFLAMLMVPWTIKPLYAVISDGLPILGSTKRTYLFLSFLIAAGCNVVAALCDPNSMSFSLVTASCGMAAATALLCGLVVQTYNTDAVRKIFSVQAGAYYCACIGAAYLGGWICQAFTPERALSIACIACALACLVATVASAAFIAERPAPIGKQVSRAIAGVRQCLTSRQFYAVAVFIWCWNFSPSFGTPLYFHYTNVMHFPQNVIGQVNSVNAAGMLLGALGYRLLCGSRLNRAMQLHVCIWASVVSTVSFVFLRDVPSATVLELIRGLTSMMGILSIYGLAADVSPRHVETIATATLISIYNFATQASTVVGGNLYVHVFHNNLMPLLLVSSATTALCGLLVRYLPAATDHGAADERQPTPLISTATSCFGPGVTVANSKWK